ncbi:MAG: TVP38/TMEM64 family protein [Clostridia bacterium]|nr:TVP38/TMEM64 family protein [Clostridia bacterium]
MRLDNKKKRYIKRNLLNIASFIFLLIAVALVVLLILSTNDKVQYWWQTYQSYLDIVQQRVENMGSEAYLIFTLMFLFSFKAFIPIYPISIVCAATGVVFPFYIALPLNIVGMGLNYTLKYWWGKRIGPGGVNVILKRNETLRIIMRQDGRGNPWLLVFFRLLPSFPINLVSQLYGSMGFNYWKYLGLSLAGNLPLLISYTVVGRHMYNPFSAGFLLPLIIIASLSSAACYLAGVVLYYKKKKRRKKNVRHQNLKKQSY